MPGVEMLSAFRRGFVVCWAAPGWESKGSRSLHRSRGMALLSEHGTEDPSVPTPRLSPGTRE